MDPFLFKTLELYFILVHVETNTSCCLHRSVQQGFGLGRLILWLRFNAFKSWNIYCTQCTEKHRNITVYFNYKICKMQRNKNSRFRISRLLTCFFFFQFRCVKYELIKAWSVQKWMFPLEQQVIRDPATKVVIWRSKFNFSPKWEGSEMHESITRLDVSSPNIYMVVPSVFSKLLLRPISNQFYFILKVLQDSVWESVTLR